jgi:putative sigma-54 modulation protein
MLIDVRARNLPLSTAQRNRVEASVLAALDRFERRIRRVMVVIEDVNGPKGGADKRCRIRVTGERDFAVQAQATDLTVTAAADRAAGAIGRNVAKAVDRLQDFGGRSRASMAGEKRRRR